MSLLMVHAAVAGPLGFSDPLESIRNALNAGPEAHETLTVLVGVALLIGLIAVSARYLNSENRSRIRRRFDILRQAADVLALNEQERADVSRVAKRAALNFPASMLLSPANLAAAAESALRQTPDPELRQRLDRLSLKLFGVPLADSRAVQPEER